MKHLKLFFFLFIFGGNMQYQVFAETKINSNAFGVPNEDGITLYYSLINEGEVRLINHYYESDQGQAKYPEDFWSGYTATTIKIPKSINYQGKEYKVTSIGGCAFGKSQNLESIVIPEGIDKIGDGAFWGCSKLKTISFPSTVTYLGVGAFYDCKAIETIVSHITRVFTFKLKWTTNRPTFEQIVYDNAILYVPNGTAVKYRLIDGWNNFLWIEEGDPTNIKNVTKKNMERSRYTISGQKVIAPMSNINIIKMSDGSTKKVLVK